MKEMNFRYERKKEIKAKKKETKRVCTVSKNFVNLKLLYVNDTPKIHLRSLGSVNFIDAWQVHEISVNLTKIS